MAGRYVPSDRWTLRYDDGLLILAAGADELYAIEDCAPATAAELVAAWERETIERRALSPPAAALLDELVTAGIITPELPPGPPSRVAVRVVGDRSPQLEHAIAAALESSAPLDRAALARSDVVVFLRTNAQLVDLYGATPEWRQRPHLLLDVAYDHTISLGPLVFAGDTACLGCLAGRIAQYWGDSPPPAAPAVQRHAGLIASVLALELEKIAAGDVGLVNATVWWDVRSWEIRRDAVHRLPWCPHCGEPQPVEALGSIDLPWARRE